MKFEKIDCGNGIAVAVSSDSMIITDVDSALDLLMSAKYEAGTKYIVVDKKNIIEDFFILSSGLAGEILQKFINYGGKIAIYGDFSHYTSKPLKDFIFESNKGKDVFFVATKERDFQLPFFMIIPMKRTLFFINYKEADFTLLPLYRQPPRVV